jgi:hypothetical protein
MATPMESTFSSARALWATVQPQSSSSTQTAQAVSIISQESFEVYDENATPEGFVSSSRSLKLPPREDRVVLGELTNMQALFQKGRLNDDSFASENKRKNTDDKIQGPAMRRLSTSSTSHSPTRSSPLRNPIDPEA